MIDFKLWHASGRENGGDPYTPARNEMVDRQLVPRDIHHHGVLAAMRGVPRHLFVPEGQAGHAYEDRALPIGDGQTISQPYMVALMTQALDPAPGQRILEIGTGSGYQAAILATLGAQVFSMDRIPRLSRSARDRLDGLGLLDRLHLRVGDGTVGWPEEAPFDGIIVTAGAPKVPPSLRSQLAAGGRMVIPVGSAGLQDLMLIVRVPDGPDLERRLCGCTFVPLVGAEGWPEDEGGL
jgi:protein-L-isoaspartate(D-aspartate) O-methyltransferase